MDATIEEFGKLYPAYATLYFKDECEIVETAPKSGLDFRRLVVSGGEGYAFPRELAGDLEILESLSYHFVKDEHFCYFDDMYCPDYTCSDILKSIIVEIKSGKVAIEDVAYLDAGMSKISHMESYEDYGSPFYVMDWERYKR